MSKYVPTGGCEPETPKEKLPDLPSALNWMLRKTLRWYGLGRDQDSLSLLTGVLHAVIFRTIEHVANHFSAFSVL